MARSNDPQPLFFATPAAFRAWLAAHHASASELWVGFHKRGSGLPSLTWPESVDEALCFGWIDGVRRSVDATSYAIRFTPRRAKSTWSAINIARLSELAAAGRVEPAGAAAFARRSEAKSAVYSYEQRQAARLSAAEEKAFRAERAAWRDFERRPPWYRRTATHWVTSAKRAETRSRRLARLVACSRAGEPLPQLRRGTEERDPGG